MPRCATKGGRLARRLARSVLPPGEHGSGAIYGVGNGVSTPQLVREVNPNYTADAVRAVVVLECVVLPDGGVGDVKILRSLDAQFGLDAEAVDAARQWRFVPGRRPGQPVAVRLVIELGFRLRKRVGALRRGGGQGVRS